MADAPEKIGRFDYGNGEIIYAEPGMIITGQTNYIRADLVDELVKALEAQIRVHAMLCRAAGLIDQDHALGTSQARAALTRIKGDVT